MTAYSLPVISKVMLFGSSIAIWSSAAASTVAASAVSRIRKVRCVRQMPEAWIGHQAQGSASERPKSTFPIWRNAPSWTDAASTIDTPELFFGCSFRLRTEQTVVSRFAICRQLRAAARRSELFIATSGMCGSRCSRSAVPLTPGDFRPSIETLCTQSVLTMNQLQSAR